MTDRLAYSVSEAAQALGVSRTLIKSAIQAGEIASIKIGARRLVPAEALHALITKGGTGAGS